MLVNEARVQQAIDYLTDTDLECANAKVDAERWDYLVKRNKAVCILTFMDKLTAQVKDAKAENDSEVMHAKDKYFECLLKFEEMSAKRKTEQLVIEVWRTEQANLRGGK